MAGPGRQIVRGAFASLPLVVRVQRTLHRFSRRRPFIVVAAGIAGAERKRACDEQRARKNRSGRSERSEFQNQHASIKKPAGDRVNSFCHSVFEKGLSVDLIQIILIQKCRRSRRCGLYLIPGL